MTQQRTIQSAFLKAPKPVLRRLMPGLTVMLLLLVGGGFSGLMSLHEKQLRENSLMVSQKASEELEQLLTEQVRGRDREHLPPMLSSFFSGALR